ncbi:YggS family pyridoxal phosphate-dependent enzyme [Leptolyngbya sp. NK1-12]|uniref:Pyridoxal phosphate homeostasis protein n=1 Tax=Leptolyngbya sp. NK1-12 TaxID=2547451 RepID=A0AA96WLH2_9CYAN|nr:YggS family pyridoxal phosphate-dependent enzyme [Leptolyngbya sp. NK1-12]WNZ24441.1 YggS family pyridoxal phosphate-dependent enzyme [Leptolyngbya sp. NK1-12]
MSTVSIEQLAERLEQVRLTLPGTVKLIAVTKQVPVEAIQAAYQLGLRDFGESRIQEAVVKQEQLQHLQDITWHLIGHLQTNKAAKALDQFQWIHSLDSLKLAQRLDQLAASLPIKPKLCLQVKIVPDPNKYGWTVPELLAALPELSQCQHLDIVGLMTIPPYGLPDAETLAIFQQARQLAEQIRQQSSLPIQELSMGMSNDYQLAVQAGATMVRLGSTLFGKRT